MAVRKKAQTATKRPRKSPKPKGELVVPEHGRGKIWKGAPANPVAGPGRPKDEVREKLLGLANGKGIPFLDQLFAGEVDVRFYGTCPKCQHRHELPDDDEYLEKILDEIGDKARSSVDHRLRGMDQALRYGLGTKDELDIASDPRTKRFIQVYTDVLHAEVSPQVAQKILQKVADQLSQEGL